MPMPTLSQLSEQGEPDGRMEGQGDSRETRWMGDQRTPRGGPRPDVGWSVDVGQGGGFFEGFLRLWSVRPLVFVFLSRRSAPMQVPHLGKTPERRPQKLFLKSRSPDAPLDATAAGQTLQSPPRSRVFESLPRPPACFAGCVRVVVCPPP